MLFCQYNHFSPQRYKKKMDCANFFTKKRQLPLFLGGWTALLLEVGPLRSNTKRAKQRLLHLCALHVVGLAVFLNEEDAVADEKEPFGAFFALFALKSVLFILKMHFSLAYIAKKQYLCSQELQRCPF